MIIERPVTGSCERCSRGHQLLIPDPGSGDLDFKRIGACFSWCAGCVRIVGRTCCWDGSVGMCHDCAALSAAPDPSLSDLVLARTALSGLSAATETMGAVDRRLSRQPVTDEEQARDAWEDAWLETGLGIVRADSAVQTAHSRGAAASVTLADAQWLTDRLATLEETWRERNGAVADRLERVGLRIHARGALALLAATLAGPPARQLVPVPVTDPRSLVTRLPGRRPASVGARPPSSAGPRPSETETETETETELEPGPQPGPVTVAPWPPSQRVPPAQLDFLGQPSAAGRRSLRPAPPPRLPPSARPAAPPAWEGRPVLARRKVARRPALAQDGVAMGPAPLPVPQRTVGRQAVVVLLVLLAFIGLVVTAAVAFQLVGLAAAPSIAAISASSLSG